MRLEGYAGSFRITDEDLGGRTARTLRALEESKQELSDLEVCEAITRSIATDWQKPHASEIPAYFFLEPMMLEPAVVQELIPPNTRIFELNELEEWKRDPSHSPGMDKPYTAVPPHLPVIPFPNIAQATCKECKKHRPVIREIVRVSEANDHEVVLKTRMIVCLSCGKIDRVKVEPEYVKF